MEDFAVNQCVLSIEEKSGKEQYSWCMLYITPPEQLKSCLLLGLVLKRIKLEETCKNSLMDLQLRNSCESRRVHKIFAEETKHQACFQTKTKVGPP